MKFLALVTAGLVAAAAISPVPAEARHHGWHMKKVCKMVYRHGHRSRVCHTMRTRW